MSDLISMNENISRKAILRELERIAEIHPYKVIGDRDSYSPYNEAWEDCISLVEERLQFLPSEEPERTGIMTNHEVACMLAELFDDPCACNYNGIDEWLPEKCELQESCPKPVGVACWEQFLKWRSER
jgi:hypothetical protein